MKESLTNLCESFHENIELIYKQKGFKLVSAKIMPMCSYTYITSGKAVEHMYELEQGISAFAGVAPLMV